MNIFLSKEEKNRLSEWKYSVIDNSITTEWFTPMYNYLVSLVPKYIAPNVLTLAGFVCIMISYYINITFAQTYKVSYFLIGALTFAYMCLDAIDGKHARNTGNSSPLGEFFDHACDNISTVFMMYIIADILGWNDSKYLLIITYMSQLIFMMSHIDAYATRTVVFDRYTGPGEFLLGYIVLLVINSVIRTYMDLPHIVIISILLGGFSLVKSVIISKIITYKTIKTQSILVLYLSFIILMSQTLFKELTWAMITKIGLSYAMITGDIIVSKMADKDIGIYLIPIILAGIPNDYIGIYLAITYYVVIILEIAYHLKLNIFKPKVRVYCNGVYDLCHFGHQNLFRAASEYGDYLIVGVHSDKDVEAYKKKSIMTLDERCKQVANSKYVDQVIGSAPMYITEDFIIKNHIDYVICSVEYDSPDDKYYAAARNLGILKVLPRTDGISTSDLINRSAIKN